MKRTCPSLNTTACHAVIFSLEKVSDCTREIVAGSKTSDKFTQGYCFIVGVHRLTRHKRIVRQKVTRVEHRHPGVMKQSRLPTTNSLLLKSSQQLIHQAQMLRIQNEKSARVFPISSPRRSHVVKRKVSATELPVSTKKQRTSRERSPIKSSVVVADQQSGRRSEVCLRGQLLLRTSPINFCERRQ